MRYPLAILAVVTLMMPDAFAATSHVTLAPSQPGKVSLTVYNGNFAVVRDEREAVLPVGTYTLEYLGIARDIDPTSVRVSSSSPGLRIIEQDYRFDLLNKSSLLARFIGRKLKYSRSFLQDGTYEKVLREGLLLSADPVVVQFGDEIEIEPEGTISLPYFPEGLTTTPTLEWRLENKLPGEQTIETLYLTDNVGWEADHVARLDESGESLSLITWVTVFNSSGVAYQDASLQLIAGQVNRATSTARPMQRHAVREMAMADSAMPEQQRFFEYHQYTIPGRTTLADNQTKQLKLMESAPIPVGTEYRLKNDFMRNQFTEPLSQRFDVLLRLVNSTDKPIPGGTVKVFAFDADGIPQLAGEDRIQHTPRDADVTLTLGKAFDLTANRVQTEWRRVGDRAMDIGYTTLVRNHKPEAVSVVVEDRLTGEWRVLEESHTSSTPDTSTLRYELDLGRDEEVTLSYTVRIRW